MRNLVYQVWTLKPPEKELRPACRVSRELMQEYAKRIGAEYRFDLNPNLAAKNAPHLSLAYEKLGLLLDHSFLEYNKVLVADMDVFPVDGLSESIFTEDTGELGLCTEPIQGRLRASVTIGGCINQANDERWAYAIQRQWPVVLPRDSAGHLKVYNSGVFVFSREGIIAARKRYLPFHEYAAYIQKQGIGLFYTIDQNYLHAMAVIHSDYKEMHNGWNSYVHYLRGPLAEELGPIHDGRTEETKFVHVQLRGADFFDRDKLLRIINKPVSEWGL